MGGTQQFRRWDVTVQNGNAHATANESRFTVSTAVFRRWGLGARYVYALFCISGSRSRAFISRTCFASSFGFRPPSRPRERAAANPARVRSRIKLRSNSASAAKRWNTSFPVALPVSIFSVTDSKKTPRLSKSVMIFTRSGKLRPRRSKRHTTNVSPVRNARRQFISSGRLEFFPLAVSS